MQERNGLEGVAKRGNWIDFGDALAEAMQQPEVYGFKTPNEVIQHVAALRGKRPHTLKNPLESSLWLKKRFPEEHEKRKTGLGMTLVMFLMKIDELDATRAGELAPRVFEGLLGQVELKEIYDELRAKRNEGKLDGKPPSPSSIDRARAFDEEVKRFLNEYSEALFGGSRTKVQPGKGVDPISPDYVIEIDGKKRIAIEVRSFRARVDRHFMINTLGYLHLLQKLVPEVLLIVPESSGYDLRIVAELRDKLGLEGIRFATLPEQGGKHLEDFKTSDP
ncbi:hypothetical protein R3X27_18935 [Tropicimonas sp. TH_r6]|uniref:hypothetical protein n=1 Tax=Tropicimonas sp. TH_r6 TaxID=3082085 RepID=UPI0029538C4A|nr:hypothetical protein [Tropicimonas sp. TH_r6]MDV7144762.1 hypothetical protein [Tropicimonas sp. TH_r6]